jgi:hypothetical protein
VLLVSPIGSLVDKKASTKKYVDDPAWKRRIVHHGERRSKVNAIAHGNFHPEDP